MEKSFAIATAAGAIAFLVASSFMKSSRPGLIGKVLMVVFLAITSFQLGQAGYYWFAGGSVVADVLISFHVVATLFHTPKIAS